MSRPINTGIVQTGGHMVVTGAAIGPHATVAGQPGAAGKPARPPTPGVRLCVAADVEKFSRWHLPEAARAQVRLVDTLARAREHAGIDEAAVELQHAGDGQFAIFPPNIDESVVIPDLVEGLAGALRDINADLNERARLRIRVALHRGHVSPGVAGWIGDSAIAVHRLVDSPALRKALRDNPSVDFGLIVPDPLYRDVIAHQYGTLRAEAFHRVSADVPEKNFTETAWIYLPADTSSASTSQV